MPVLPSYRNQSINLLCKSIDLFLYEGNSDINVSKLNINQFFYNFLWQIVWKDTSLHFIFIAVDSLKYCLFSLDREQFIKFML